MKRHDEPGFPAEAYDEWKTNAPEPFGGCGTCHDADRDVCTCGDGEDPAWEWTGEEEW